MRTTMLNSIMIAKILGPMLILIGIGLLVNMKYFQKVISDFSKNAALIYVSGVFTFVLGAVILVFHNQWSLNWSVIITVIGWLTVIKGACLIVIPEQLMKMTEAFKDKTMLIRIDAIVIILVGAVLLMKVIAFKQIVIGG